MRYTFFVLLEVVIIAVSFFCEAMFGFGGGLLAVPLLSIFMSVKEAVTLVLVFQLSMGLLLLRSYKDVPKHLVVSMGIGMVAGSMIGVSVLVALPEQMLRTILAIAILAFVVPILHGKKSAIHLSPSPLLHASAGLIGGILQGLLGTGGPVLTLYLLTLGLSAKSFRATLIALFFISSIVRVAVSTPLDLFTPAVRYTALIAFPVFLLAIFSGQRFFKRLSEDIYRKGVAIILVVSALFMLIR